MIKLHYCAVSQGLQYNCGMLYLRQFFQDKDTFKKRVYHLKLKGRQRTCSFSGVAWGRALVCLVSFLKKTQRCALIRHSEIKILNISFSRVEIEPTTCCAQDHTLVRATAGLTSYFEEEKTYINVIIFVIIFRDGKDNYFFLYGSFNIMKQKLLRRFGIAIQFFHSNFIQCFTKNFNI